MDADDSVLFSDMSLAYGFANRFDFGASFSFLLNQSSDQAESGARFSGTGLNEVRLLGKYRFVDRAPLGAALALSLNINQAKNSPFAGSGSGPTTNIEAVFDSRLGNWVFATNLGYRIRQEGSAIPDAVYDPLGDQAIASIGASYYSAALDTKFIGEIFAAKPMRSSRTVDGEHVASEALLGLKYDAARNASLQFGGGTRLSEGLFTPDWRVYLGLNITLDLNPQRIPEVAAPAPAAPPEPAVAQVQIIKGYLQRDMETLKTRSFDDLSKTHEFLLRTSIPRAELSEAKPPFEIIRLENFDFDFGSSEIRPEYQPMLRQLADYLGTEPRVLKIQVEGHTDSLGTPERNKKRSQQRAERVRDFLMATGKIQNIQTLAVGFGSERPIADNGNFQGRKQNRRVEVRIIRSLPEALERRQ